MPFNAINNLTTSFFECCTNLIYPPVCGFCDKLCKKPICNKCNIQLQKNMKCKIDYYKKSFKRHIYLFKYEGKIREKIVQYKFNDKPYIYESFVNLIIKNKKIYSFLKNYDIIIPVPISKKRKIKRGYNQSELIAKKLSKNLDNLEFMPNILYKKVDTVPQSSLNKIQRHINVKNVYKAKNTKQIQNKKILIFDDIFTTGSTAQECSKILKQAGARAVDVLTIAKD